MVTRLILGAKVVTHSKLAKSMTWSLWRVIAQTLCIAGGEKYVYSKRVYEPTGYVENIQGDTHKLTNQNKNF